MALFMDEVVTPPASLPVIATDAALVAAVVSEILNARYCGEQ